MFKALMMRVSVNQIIIAWSPEEKKKRRKLLFKAAQLQDYKSCKQIMPVGYSSMWHSPELRALDDHHEMIIMMELPLRMKSVNESYARLACHA